MSITGIESVRSDISEMLSKMRDVTSKSKVFGEINPSIAAPKTFEDVLSVAKNAFSSVSTMQTETDHLKNSYVMGDGNVSMSQVIVATEKSKLAFEGLITVRNKLLEAYKEVMNMPV